MNYLQQVSDGSQQTGGLLEFIILPRSNKPPKLVVKKEIEVKLGQIFVISNKNLNAEDVDSDHSQLKYKISQVPSEGFIEVFQESRHRWIQLFDGDTFTQRDLELSRVRSVYIIELSRLVI